jgi:hypothetical protein
LAIANLAHLVFAKGRQKPNKLNSHRTAIRCGAKSATFVRISLRSVRSASLRQHGRINNQVFFLFLMLILQSSMAKEKKFGDCVSSNQSELLSINNLGHFHFKIS